MERLKALDGLRGLAALAVVFAHYTPATRWAPDELYLFPWMHIFPLGNIAVVCFFGLSAFLLAWKAEQSFDPRIFIVNRLLRIVPLYVVVIVVTVCVVSFVQRDTGVMRESIRDAWFYAAFLFNWPVAFGQMRGLNELGHLWSLCVEMQFYAVFAACFAIARNASFALVVCASLCIGMASRLMLSSGGLYLESLSYTEVFAFCAGAGVTYMRGGRLPNIPWTILLPLFLIAGLIWPTVNWSGTISDSVMYPVFAVLICMTIWGITTTDNFFTRFLAKLQWLGTISYGIYVWHLIAKFIMYEIDKRLAPGHFGILLIFGGYLASCVAMAWLTYKYVEAPFNKMRSRLFVVEHQNLLDQRNPSVATP